MDLDLSKIKKVFFIGIGGIGISAGAQLAISLGMEVSGLNDEESPKTLEPLRQAGAKIIMLKELKHLPKADLYVYSDAWIHRGPEIIDDAKMTGKPVLSYFVALGSFVKEYKNVIAVAGTHGKTTTTAMIAEIMIDAGLDPTVIVGSFVKSFESNFRKGKNEYLVVEADEYNRHFLNFNPYITVITNIEADHLDYYKDLNDIKSAFQQLIKQTTHAVIYNAKDANVVPIIPEEDKKLTVNYARYISSIPKLLVPGEHNKENAAAAFTVAEILHIDGEKARKSLQEFSGTWRRLEKKGITNEGVIIYDDYAHHPTEIKASLQALRELYPKGQKNITVLFQPHLYSRTKAFFKEFTECFDQADNIFLLPIYFAREKTDESISSKKLAEAIKMHRGEAVDFSDFTQAKEWIKKMKLDSKDVFVTMGAGEAYKVAEEVFRLN